MSKMKFVYFMHNKYNSFRFFYIGTSTLKMVVYIGTLIESFKKRLLILYVILLLINKSLKKEANYFKTFRKYQIVFHFILLTEIQLSSQKLTCTLLTR